MDFAELFGGDDSQGRQKTAFCGEKDLAIEFLVPQQGREVRQWVVLYVKERNTLICALASDFGG